MASEVIQRRSFQDGTKDAYYVVLTNGAREGYRTHIFRKDGTSDMLKVSSKEHYSAVVSRIVNGKFSEDDKPSPEEPDKKTRRGK